MDIEDKFIRHVNIFLLEHADKMLEKTLQVITLNNHSHLLMQAFMLAEYDRYDIYFVPGNMSYRITRYFNEVAKYDYSIRRTDRSFSNEYRTHLSEKFDFIRNLPENYGQRFAQHHKKVFAEYWSNFDTYKTIYLSSLRTENEDTIGGETYAKILHYFLGKKFISKKKNRHLVELILSINNDIDFVLEIDLKELDREFNKYQRFPDSPGITQAALHISGHKFYFNCIEHPTIRSIVSYNPHFLVSFYNEDIESALKWLFIHCDATAFYINMCFDFYSEHLLKYINTYS